jgi:hypothetical protein
MEIIKLHPLSPTPLSPSGREGNTLQVFGKGFGETTFTKGVSPKGSIQ